VRGVGELFFRVLTPRRKAEPSAEEDLIKCLIW
jgi:hypothetical protein